MSQNNLNFHILTGFYTVPKQSEFPHFNQILHWILLGPKNNFRIKTEAVTDRANAQKMHRYSLTLYELPLNKKLGSYHTKNVVLGLKKHCFRPQKTSSS